MSHLIPLTSFSFEPGDRMDRDEFLAAWEEMPGLKFAELVDGVVYVPSPLSHEHGLYDAAIGGLLLSYAARAKTCQVLMSATWLMLDSAPQPDIALSLLPEYGGRKSVTGKLASGVPELAVEISLSSRSYDLGPKLALYQRAGVLEYVTLLLRERRIEWRVLRNGSYELHPSVGGIFESTVFPGLRLDEQACWDLDYERLLAALAV